MKTSFNFEEYRKNLAEELKEGIKENGFDGAREKLNFEQESPEYKIAQGLKKLKTNEIIDVPLSKFSWNQIDEVEKKELMKDFKEVDISNEIPKSLKLIIDAVRLKIAKNEKYQLTNIVDELGEKAKQQFSKEFKETGGTIGILNKISKGKFADKRYLNHIVNAYDIDSQFRVYKNTDSHRTMIQNSTFEGGSTFLPTDIITAYRLHFNTGYANYLYEDPTKKFIIISPEKITKIMASNENSDGYSCEESIQKRYETKEELDNYILSLKTTHEDGAEVYEVDRKDKVTIYELLKRGLPINEEGSHYMGFELPVQVGDNYTRWSDIADTVVDLEAGKAWYRKSE